MGSAFYLFCLKTGCASCCILFQFVRGKIFFVLCSEGLCPPLRFGKHPVRAPRHCHTVVRSSRPYAFSMWSLRRSIKVVSYCGVSSHAPHGPFRRVKVLLIR